MKKRLVTIGVALVAVAAVATAAWAAVVEVTPANPQGWGFFDENAPFAAPTGSFVVGPGAPPAGAGSARLPVADTTDGQALGTLAYQGTALSSITALSYSTYRTSGDPALAIALQFGVDADGTTSGTQFTRLVFEPYLSGGPAVVTGAWQTWNAYTSTDGWWFSRFPYRNTCSPANSCSWAQALAVLNQPSVSDLTLFKAGSGWNAFDGNVDAFTIGINGADTTWDFEPALSPATKDDCKNGGWETFNTPRHFKNQGDCIQYFNTEK